VHRPPELEGLSEYGPAKEDRQRKILEGEGQDDFEERKKWKIARARNECQRARQERRRGREQGPSPPL